MCSALSLLVASTGEQLLDHADPVLPWREMRDGRGYRNNPPLTLRGESCVPSPALSPRTGQQHPGETPCGAVLWSHCICMVCRRLCCVHPKTPGTQGCLWVQLSSCEMNTQQEGAEQCPWFQLPECFAPSQLSPPRYPRYHFRASNWDEKHLGQEPPAPERFCGLALLF